VPFFLLQVDTFKPFIGCCIHSEPVGLNMQLLLAPSTQLS
jgi:hypothetical protein